MNWVISVPAWGERCVTHLAESSLPSILAALQLIDSSNVRFMIHTDDPGRVDALLQQSGYGSRSMILPVPEGDGRHGTLGHCHRQVLDNAQPGEAVVFINADHVCSRECFVAAERRFAEGKKFIECMGIRTLENTAERPPINAGSRELLEWGWQRPHSWTRECTWGTGRAHIPSVLFFPKPDGSVVMHGFHLHPFALIRPAGALSFDRVTIDDDLIMRFTYNEIHIVTDADEMAMVEMSPASYDLGVVPQIITTSDVVMWAKRATNERHRWQFGHRIIIKGSGGDLSDVETASIILRSLEVMDTYPFLTMIQDNRVPEPIGSQQYLSAERRQYLQQWATARAVSETVDQKGCYYISMPVWGPLFVGIACKYTIPALRQALARVERPAQFIVYTDDRNALQEVLKGAAVEWRDVPNSRDRELFKVRDMHKQLLNEIPNGHIALLLNADHFVSRELFEVIEAVLGQDQNRKVLVSGSPRAMINGELPPIGASARELLEWVWRNKHPIVEQSIWGRGLTSFPNTLFFQDEAGENVVMHGFQLHPFALVKGRPLKFQGTIDDDLLGNYEAEEIVYMEQPQAAIADLSTNGECEVDGAVLTGTSRDVSQYGTRSSALSIDYVTKWAKPMMQGLHVRNLSHQLRIKGTGELPTNRIIHRIMTGMGYRDLPPLPPLEDESLFP